MDPFRLWSVERVTVAAYSCIRARLHNNEMNLTRSAWPPDARPSQVISALARHSGVETNGIAPDRG
jgi:hypothetical protein